MSLVEINSDLPATVVVGIDLPDTVAFDPGLTGTVTASERNGVNWR